MVKSTVTIAFALALSILPATAQQTKPDTAQQETSIIGMPIYSSDGQKLGEVTQVGMHEGRHAVVAQLEPSLGSGAKVLIPAEMMRQHQNDRLELSMTAEEVRNTVSKP
jgi:ribosomal 30S subunit maturation factor RimM